jgi:hypothetical protein
VIGDVHRKVSARFLIAEINASRAMNRAAEARLSSTGHRSRATGHRFPVTVFRSPVTL